MRHCAQETLLELQRGSNSVSPPLAAGQAQCPETHVQGNNEKKGLHSCDPVCPAAGMHAAECQHSGLSSGIPNLSAGTGLSGRPKEVQSYLVDDQPTHSKKGGTAQSLRGSAEHSYHTDLTGKFQLFVLASARARRWCFRSLCLTHMAGTLAGTLKGRYRKQSASW